jgi:hypothetical protein
VRQLLRDRVKASGGGDAGASATSTAVTVTAATLPADDVAAAKAVGKAMATEKDAAKLAGMLLAFFDRIGIPVVAADLKSMKTTKAPFTALTDVHLHELEIVGLARANARGDRRPYAVAMAGLFPKRDNPFGNVDLPSALASVEAHAGEEQGKAYALVATAIHEDLKARGFVDSHPMLSPAAIALFGIAMAKADLAGLAKAPDPGDPRARTSTCLSPCRTDRRSSTRSRTPSDRRRPSAGRPSRPGAASEPCSLHAMPSARRWPWRRAARRARCGRATSSAL